MNAAAFRQFYDYHFAVNRMLWHFIGQLAPEQFTTEMTYSQGSVRDQVVHLLNVDDLWFSELRGVEPPEPPFPPTTIGQPFVPTGTALSSACAPTWPTCGDDMLFSTPIADPEEDKDLHRLAGAAPRRQSRHRPSRAAAADIERPRA